MNRIMLDIRLRTGNDIRPACDAEHMYALQNSHKLSRVPSNYFQTNDIYKGGGPSESRDNANSLCPQTSQKQKSLQKHVLDIVVPGRTSI